MKPISVFLLAFYLIALFGRPAEVLSLEHTKGNAEFVLDASFIFTHTSYSIPAASSHSNLEVKNSFSFANFPSLSSIVFNGLCLTINQKISFGLTPLIVSLHQWPKLLINAP